MTLNAERVTFTKKKKTVACPVPLAPLADTHAHLLSFWGKDVPETLLRAKAAGVDLLVTALIFGQKLRDGQPRRLGDQTARRSRRGKAVLGKNALIRGAELHHKLLLFIMSHKGDIHSENFSSFPNFQKTAKQ